MAPGYFTTKYCLKQDMIRVTTNVIVNQPMHARRKGLLDIDKETKGSTYDYSWWHELPDRIS